MPKRENFPNQRKYNIFPAPSTTSLARTAPSSLERATDILVCLGNGINSATEIAAYTEYSVSTVHRLLQSLAELGWVIQDEISHKYFLGSLVHKLASNKVSAHRYLVLHALKEMYRLADLAEETVILCALQQLNYLKLHDIPSPHNLRIIEASDKLKGQYLGATPKVLLSQLEDKELKMFMKHVKNEPATPNSVVDNDVLLEQIKETRNAGYSVSYGERINGATCIAAPVFNYFCPIALSIIGPEGRLKSRINEFVNELVASTRLISEDIAGAFDGQGGSG
jgi:IclR family transcriptional regulator, KDG regulon repressor